MRRFAIVVAVVTLLIGTGAVVAAAQEHNGARTLSTQGTSASRGQEPAEPSSATSQQSSADDEDCPADNSQTSTDCEDCSAGNSQTSTDCEDIDETGPDEADGDNNQRDEHEASGHNHHQGDVDRSRDSQEHER